MPYPANFLRLQVQGRGVQNEIWSWSLSIVPNFEEPGGLVQPSEVPAPVIAAIKTFHTASSCAPAVIDLIKLNLIGPDGKYVSKTRTVFHEVLPAHPGTGSLMQAPQVAVAISLLTDRKRGLANRGRFYPPYTKIGPDTDGYAGQTPVQTLANAAVTMINAINANTGGVVGIASNTREGMFEPVRSVEVGRVFDTIRRRRNQLVEAYVKASNTVITAP